MDRSLMDDIDADIAHVSQQLPTTPAAAMDQANKSDRKRAEESRRNQQQHHDPHRPAGLTSSRSVSSSDSSLVSHVVPLTSELWAVSNRSGNTNTNSSSSSEQTRELQQRLEAHLQFLEQEAIRVQRQLAHAQYGLTPPEDEHRPTNLPQPAQPISHQAYIQSLYLATGAPPAAANSAIPPPSAISVTTNTPAAAATSAAAPAPSSSLSANSNLSPHEVHSSTPPIKSTSSRARKATSRVQISTPEEHSPSSSGGDSPPSKKAKRAASTTRGKGRGAAAVASTGSSSASADSAGGSDSSAPIPCNFCRRKKKSCNGGTPCSRCKSLDLRCSYPHAAVKRGPAPGVVTHLRNEVAQLQAQLKAVRQAVKVANQPPPPPKLTVWSNLDTRNSKVIRAFLSQMASTRDQTYLHAYFFQLNNSLFPFLDRQEFAAVHARAIADRTIEPPLSWIFQYSIAVAIGASISGDAQYAKNAATVGRIVSCTMFDLPSYDCIRSFLLLSFYLISQNQHRRAACCLAIAKRMIFLVPMLHASTIVKMNPLSLDNKPVKLTTLEHSRLHEQCKLLLQFLEDMLVSAPWWKGGWNPQEAVDLETGKNSSGVTTNHSSAAPTAPLSPFSSSSSDSLVDLDSTSNMNSIGFLSPDLMKWPDLLINPSKMGLYDKEPTMEELEETKEQQQQQQQMMQHQSTSQSTTMAEHKNSEFAYNSVNPTKLRGGKKGLFEFQDTSSVSTTLFDGSQPSENMALKSILYVPPSPPSASSSLRSTKNKKRKSRSDVANEEEEESKEVSKVSTPSRPNSGSDLQLNLMRVMCTLTSIRGDITRFKKDTNNSIIAIHKCLSVLDESDRKLLHQQQSLPNASSVLLGIRALVMCMKTVSLKLLQVLDAGDENTQQQIHSAAKQTSMLTQQCDLTFCPFMAIFYHLVSQCHLASAHTLASGASSSASSSSSSSSSSLTNLFKYLLLDLQYHERLSLRWDYARPIFQNLQARIRGFIQKYFHSNALNNNSHSSASRNIAALPRILDQNLTQLLNLSLPQLNATGVNSNQVGGSLCTNDPAVGCGSFTFTNNNTSPFVHHMKLNFGGVADPAPAQQTIENINASLVVDTRRRGHNSSNDAMNCSVPAKATSLTAAPSSSTAALDTEPQLPPRKKHRTHPPKPLVVVPSAADAAAAASSSAFMHSSYFTTPFAELPLTLMGTNGFVEDSELPLSYTPPLFPGSAAVSHRLSKYVEPIDLRRANSNNARSTEPPSFASASSTSGQQQQQVQQQQDATMSSEDAIYSGMMNSPIPRTSSTGSQLQQLQVPNASSSSSSYIPPFGSPTWQPMPMRGTSDGTVMMSMNDASRELLAPTPTQIDEAMFLNETY